MQRRHTTDSSRVKVAHVSTVDLSLRYLLLNQMLSIREAGMDVVAVSSPGPHVGVVEDAGIRHVPVPMTRSASPLSDLRALLTLYRVMRRERFDIVHTHTPKAGLLGQYAALLARVPTRVHTIHGLYFPGHMNPRLRWAYVMLERITMAFSTRNLSQSPEDVPVAVEEGICAADKIECIGNGIDVEAFDPATYSAARRAEIRASLGLTPEHTVIGTVARFVAEKGYLELFKAARIVREKRPDVRFLLIGEVANFKKDALSTALLDEMNIADVAQFVGHRTDIVDMYAAMDIFTLPSHREGFPRAPMEAACMGLPAVLTDIRGCRQTVDSGVTGYLVPLRDHEALAAKLLELVDKPELRSKLGEGARAKALAEFDERHVFARVIRAYEALLRARPERAPAGVLNTG